MKLFLIFLFLYATMAEDPDYYFPDNFIFGSATSTYQIEGGWNADGKGENIFDRAAHQNPNWTFDGSNGDVACDSYHKYKEDVQLLKNMGVNFYRFSLSWSRILPRGKTDFINLPGIDYYNNLINELLANGIEPFVTIFHWDLPQPLQDEGGWPKRTLADYYVDYARIAFQYFGDRVKYWITFNEPLHFCEEGYSEGRMPPFIKNRGIGGYECAHTVLIAHGRAYRMYEKEFKPCQNGSVGITVDTHWKHPNNTEVKSDILAAEKSLQMNYGWFVHPVILGNYPQIMIDSIRDMSLSEGLPRSRLPEFTEDEIELIKGSYDFLGLNSYSTNLCYKAADSEGDHPSHWRDVGVQEYQDPSWPASSMFWLKVVPWGMRKLLNWIKNEYNNPKVYITENGYAGEGLFDEERADYYKKYLYEVLKAIHEDGCNVQGYAAWSLMDNFEWIFGYEQKFGLHDVDFTDPNRPRTPKYSSYVYMNIIATRHIDWDYNPSWNITH